MTSLAHDNQTDSSISGLLGNIIVTVLERVEQTVDGWTADLNHIAHGEESELGEVAGEGLGKAAEGGSAKTQAGLKGAQAGLQGKNPVWGAIKGAWAGGSAAVRAAIVTAAAGLLLMAVLSPVLLLVFLLSLLIIAAAQKAGRSQHH